MRNSYSLLLTTILLVSLPVASQGLETQFQEILDSVYKANVESVGIMVHVESPDDNISWTSAIGYSDKKTRELINKDQPVLIASNTKPYVAAAILKLVENKKIELDQPIRKLVQRKTRSLLKREGYDLDQITVRHLLSHTSGINDYVNDNYFMYVNQNKDYEWTRDKQILLTATTGDKLNEPGKGFSYADVNYLLLTEIIEKKTRKRFYTAIRLLLNYEELGIENTWFKNLEDAPDSALALCHQYSNKRTWDSYDLNPSWDMYGGGGIAANTKDCALFFQALFEGEIIKDEALLKSMSTYIFPRKKSNYCLGIRKIPFDGYKVYYHGGWWGTDVIYSPETNASITVFTLLKEKREEINPFLGKTFMKLLLKK